MAGKEAGIYAIVDIVSNPKLMVDSEASTSHWVHEKDKRQKRLRVKIKHLLKLTDNPIKKRTLEKIAGLGNLSILRYQRGTNFKVTKDEWLIISRLIRKKLETKA